MFFVLKKQCLRNENKQNIYWTTASMIKNKKLNCLSFIPFFFMAFLFVEKAIYLSFLTRN